MPYTVNGDPVSLPEPVLKDGATFVPIADLANMLGGYVDWSHAEKSAKIELNGKIGVVKSGEAVMQVDGMDHDLKAEPYIDDSLLWAPARMFRDVFGMSLKVDDLHVTLSV